MDSFESVLCTLLEREGYWVRPRFKVNLTKADKRRIGRPSSPRWELDVLAYKARANALFVVECKSYLDSRGVTYANVASSKGAASSRYKLFVEPVTRRVVLRRLVSQLVESGLTRPLPKVTLCLAAGHCATARDRQRLRHLFAKKSWLLWDEDWHVGKLRSIAESKHDDEVTAVVAKLLLRHDDAGRKR